VSPFVESQLRIFRSAVRAYGARTGLALPAAFPCISLHSETPDFQAKRI